MGYYVVSDFHGNGKAFDILKSKLDKNDTVFMLGDACDRGPDGIRILKEVMNDKRFIYILGNHDDFILRSFLPTSVYNKNYTTEDAIYSWNMNTGPSYQDWIELRKKHPIEFKKLINWLKKCPVCLTFKYHNKVYRLAHAKFPTGYENLSWENFEKNYPSILEQTLWYVYLNDGDINSYVKKGTITLIGHTAVSNEECHPFPGLYVLDSGLGYGINSIRIFNLITGKIQYLNFD